MSAIYVHVVSSHGNDSQVVTQVGPLPKLSHEGYRCTLICSFDGTLGMI